jgi:hypothetical protein
LAVLGLKLRQLDLFAPIRQLLRIPQKIVRYSPVDKLFDAFVALLAGAHGLVEINSRLRSDPALQAAFGRSACAEQSVVQDTLDAATAANITQMEQALEQIYRAHSRGYVHDYSGSLQILDADLSGQPCGPKAAFATKGYFARQRNRRGRQLGRVVAGRYDEIVVDRLFPGNVQLNTTLPELIIAAEATLELDEDEQRRQRTLVRVDAGGGSQSDLNWLLARGYQILAKEYSAERAAKLAASVREWVADPRHPGREMGWVTIPASEYVRPVRRMAVRCKKANGQWGVGVLITTLADAEVVTARGLAAVCAQDEHKVLQACVYLYDGRGGAVETTFKEDNQGLGQRVRHKKRFAAQQLAGYLTTLAHNVLVWSRQWLRPQAPRLRGYGLKRLVRDVWQISGAVELDEGGAICGIVLNEANGLAHHLVSALQALLGREQVVVSLGET